MSIRPATRGDIPAIVETLTKAFWNEDAVGRFMHPYREQYPSHLDKYWRRILRGGWWDTHHTHLVAINDEGKIVGFSKWTLVGGV